MTILLLIGFGWVTGLFPDIDEKPAIDRIMESKIMEKPTPDQLWEMHNDKRRNDNPDKVPPKRSAAEVVPRQVLETEERVQAEDGWSHASSENIDIPPIDPRDPDYPQSNDPLPPVAPESEVIPEELSALENRTLQIPSEVEDIIPVAGDPENYLQPDELPPEPAEMQVEPESLKVEEGRFND